MKNGNRQPAHALALALVLCMALAAAGCGEAAQETAEFSYAEVPAYADAAYAEINGNVPYFSESDLTLETFESYSELDGICQHLPRADADGGTRLDRTGQADGLAHRAL